MDKGITELKIYKRSSQRKINTVSFETVRIESSFREELKMKTSKA